MTLSTKLALVESTHADVPSDDHRPPSPPRRRRRRGFPAGAEAFRGDVPDAEVVLLDTGHFALVEELDAIANRIDAVLRRVDGWLLVTDSRTHISSTQAA